MSSKDQEPQVRGIRLAEYQSWRHHPVTRLFRNYLRDAAGDRRQGVLERWEQGVLDLATEHAIRAQVGLLTELADLPFEAMVTFYDQIADIENPAIDAAAEEDVEDAA